MSKLREILNNKIREVEVAKRRVSEADLQAQAEQAAPHRRKFIKALNDAASKDGTAIIAELKQKSPSTGALTNNYNPAEIAKAYEAGGAACLSVLTDAEYFGGAPEHLQQARNATKLPVLRKDFIIDPYQITESAAMGADAILLIAAAINPADLEDMLDRARKAGLAVLLEFHSAEMLKDLRDLACRNDVLLGINSRDLNTLEVDFNQVLKNIRMGIIFPELMLERAVLESGITSREQIEQCQKAGASRFLVGTALMLAPDPAAKLRELRGKF